MARGSRSAGPQRWRAVRRDTTEVVVGDCKERVIPQNIAVEAGEYDDRKRMCDMGPRHPRLRRGLGFRASTLALRLGRGGRENRARVIGKPLLSDRKMGKSRSGNR